jgi:hypothetical protein
MGGTQILNTGSDWMAGSPMPPGRFMPSPSFQDGPQPVPGQPPIQFDPSKLTDQYKNDWSPRNPDGTLATGGVTQIPGGPYGNRGSGQPINQPMQTDNINKWAGPSPFNQPMATSQPLPWDGSGGQSSMGGSLQSLGGGLPQLSPAQLDQIRQKTPFGMGNDLANQYSLSQYNQTNPHPPIFQNGFIPSRDEVANFNTWAQGANQSGMVTLRAPDGSQTKAVPADQVAHWLSRGAVRV